VFTHFIEPDKQITGEHGFHHLPEAAALPAAAPYLWAEHFISLVAQMLFGAGVLHGFAMHGIPVFHALSWRPSSDTPLTSARKAWISRINARCSVSFIFKNRRASAAFSANPFGVSLYK